MAGSNIYASFTLRPRNWPSWQQRPIRNYSSCTTKSMLREPLKRLPFCSMKCTAPIKVRWSPAGIWTCTDATSPNKRKTTASNKVFQIPDLARFSVCFAFAITGIGRLRIVGLSQPDRPHRAIATIRITSPRGLYICCLWGGQRNGKRKIACR